jgi:hypothetical protein
MKPGGFKLWVKVDSTCTAPTTASTWLFSMSDMDFIGLGMRLGHVSPPTRM